MKVFEKRGIWFEFALILLMVLAVALMVSLPWSIPAMTHHTPGEKGIWFEKYMVILTLSAVFAVMILWQARCIVHLLRKGNPFVVEMVKRLRVIGFDCLLFAGFYMIASFVVATFYMAVALIAFSVVGFIMLIVSQIFRQAIRFKEENDRVI